MYLAKFFSFVLYILKLQLRKRTRVTFDKIELNALNIDAVLVFSKPLKSTETFLIYNLKLYCVMFYLSHFL